MLHPCFPTVKQLYQHKYLGSRTAYYWNSCLTCICDFELWRVICSALLIFVCHVGKRRDLSTGYAATPAPTNSRGASPAQDEEAGQNGCPTDIPSSQAQPLRRMWCSPNVHFSMHQSWRAWRGWKTGKGRNRDQKNQPGCSSTYKKTLSLVVTKKKWIIIADK